MKPKNFPGRKVMRQIIASKPFPTIYDDADFARIDAARNIRTKKDRRGRQVKI